jgi:adenylate cyclase
MIFSLQKRFLLFLLLPVTALLAATGIASFMYARSYLLDQWTSTAKLKLEKTAHRIEMKLDRKRAIIDLIVKSETIPDPGVMQAFLVQQLSAMPGVSLVDVQVLPPAERQALEKSVGDLGNFAAGFQGTARIVGDRIVAMNHGHMHMMGPTGHPHGMQMQPMMRQHHPELSFDDSGNFLSIVRELRGTAGNPSRIITVTLSFDSFMTGILEAGEWEGSYACLVKSDGRYLAHTDQSMSRAEKLGGSGDPLEKEVLKEMKTKKFGTVFGEGHPPDKVIGFYKVPTTDWYLVLVSRGSVIMAPIVRFRFNYTLAGVLSLICVGLLIHWSTRPVGRSVKEISKAAEEVEKGDYPSDIPVDTSDEIGQLKHRFNNMVHGLKQRDLIEKTFGRYVDKKVAAELLENPEALELGGKSKTVTIMMADLRGFTEMSERLQPDQVIKILNRYYSQTIPVIEAHRGIIVDFYGDAILVFFNGTDKDVSERALDAVKCALAIQGQADEVSEQNEAEGLPALHVGIGIHTGEVVVGNIGSESRAKYGIVGSPVNETDRIQSCAEGGVILISDQTYKVVKTDVEVGSGRESWLKGLEGPRDLYEVKSVKV